MFMKKYESESVVGKQQLRPVGKVSNYIISQTDSLKNSDRVQLIINGQD